MKIEKNFTTGVLSGICGILVLLVMMGSTTPEITNKFEFHDLGDTRGLIFNKVTGEMNYKEIRAEPLPNTLNSTDEIVVKLNIPFGQPGSSILDPFYIQN